MSEPETSATMIANIEGKAVESIRLTAVAIERLGGATARRHYVSRAARTLLGAMIAAEGVDGACDLVGEMWAATEEYDQGCGDGRRAP